MSLKAWWVLLLLFVSFPATADVQLAALPGHWGLVIGNAYYGSSFSLKHAIADANLMQEVLEKARFQTTQILEATYCETMEAFADLVNEMASERDKNPGIDQVVVIYYSGHGAVVPDLNGDEQDGLDGAIVPVDVELPSLARAIPDDLLSAWLDQLGRDTKVVVILDCGNMGAKGLAAPGRLILAGSAKEQCSYEDEQLAHGVFTYYLVDGLRKGEKNNNGKISLQAAFDYTQKHVSEYVKDRLNGKQGAEITDGIGQPAFLFNDPAKCPTLPISGESSTAQSR